MDHALTDRRSTKRHRLRIPPHFCIWGSSGPKRKVESVDISERGVLLETDLAVQLNSILDVQLNLSVEVANQVTKWHCRGRVIHIVPPINVSWLPRVGVSFDWLDRSRPELSLDLR